TIPDTLVGFGPKMVDKYLTPPLPRTLIHPPSFDITPAPAIYCQDNTQSARAAIFPSGVIYSATIIHNPSFPQGATAMHIDEEQQWELDTLGDGEGEADREDIHPTSKQDVELYIRTYT